MHVKAQRIAALLEAAGLAPTVRELPDSTRTAAEAAEAIGTTVAQIAKSLVFVTAGDAGGHADRVVLVVASGTNRVDVTKVADIIGAPVSRPDAKTVKALTGYSIGGVPPFAHASAPTTLIDAELMRFDEIWAAAGTPNAVFRLTPADLVALSGGTIDDVRA
jgi:prolyl-tRNA editing enzyme YbaK/EbsC (Cys-tRNA(Pro) deacylase)